MSHRTHKLLFIQAAVILTGRFFLEITVAWHMKMSFFKCPVPFMRVFDRQKLNVHR